MSVALSKRQQARNEKVLQDLVHSVPGNNFCADCQARNPAWASWSLGIFLCMRCAAIHRKLGTHISKVKSLSMDSWSNEQVENMRKVGNAASNKTYNPQNKRPPVPLDADEADSAMERFIRSKYMNHGLASSKRHNTGSTESDETPPPLPPKTPSRFGFRSASSIFPIGSKTKKAEARRDPSLSPRDLQPSASSSHRNKASQVFGASVQYDDGGNGDDTERKLAKLRDMGFTDDQRNALVMKGVGGNLEKTIEALVRLGEGDRRSPNSLTTSTRDTSSSINRSLTPATSVSGHDAARGRPLSPATSNNPFDMLDTPAQPLSSQSTGTLQNKNPYLSTNPFGMPTQQNNVVLDQAFQNLSLAPPSQPLFPHHTGGMAAPQQQQQQQQQHMQVMYQQSMTPPVQSHNYGATAFNGSYTYPQPTAQPAPASYNPFFAQAQQQQQQQQQQQPQPQPLLSVNTTGFSGNYGNNPFTRSPTRIQSPTLTQIPEQAQQNFYAAPLPPPAQPHMNNPFFQMPMATAPQQQQQPPTQMPQQYGLAPQPTAYMSQPAMTPQRPDKSSILALYNYPQLAPTPFQAQNTDGQGAAAATQGPNQLFSSQTFPQAATQQQQQQPPAAVVSPAPGSKNPFLGYGGGEGQAETPAAQQQQPLVDVAPKQYNASRESMMALGMEWSNGRHSPDAFASLSARHVR